MRIPMNGFSLEAVEKRENPEGAEKGERFRWGMWRRRWDSNPRWGFPHVGFQDRCLKPLGHSSDEWLSKPREPILKGHDGVSFPPIPDPRPFHPFGLPI